MIIFSVNSVAVCRAQMIIVIQTVPKSAQINRYVDINTSK